MEVANQANRVDFERPPVNEVVFSLQFSGEVIDEVGALSDFWPKIKDRYPKSEKHPPVPPAREQFDVPPPEGSVQFELLSGPPSQRYWFLSEDETRIVQVQSDRLSFNWRQVKGDEDYPRYEHLFPEFLSVLETFVQILEQQEKDGTAAWCELTYVNPVPAEGAVPNTHGQLAMILKFLERDPPREALPPVEDTQLQQRFRITSDETGEPIGRLYISAVPAIRKTDSKPAYVVTLLARGRPDGDDLIESVRAFFNKAHELIVSGFREVTTEEMHEEWGLKADA